jgi:hypothetical protein
MTDYNSLPQKNLPQHNQLPEGSRDDGDSNAFTPAQSNFKNNNQSLQKPPAEDQ